MVRKGTYTGRILKDIEIRYNGSWQKKDVKVGKISGYNGNGEPIYNLERAGNKVGEMGNKFIKEKLKKNNKIVGRCKICGLGFTQKDYDNASKGVCGDECLVGDYDNICYPCQLKGDNK